MDRDVLACVVGQEPAARIAFKRAKLAGYRKARLPHESYPLLAPDANCFAEGVLLCGLNKQELDKIVFFEGEEFELSPVRLNHLMGLGSRRFFLMRV